ncbi:hypothetical protein ACFQV8_12625 [Pseudonocardia benzenivorans]
MWAVFFPADAVDPGAAAPLASWHGHPLLAAFGSTAFGGHRRGGAQRLRVPDEDRPQWLAQLHELDAELRGRRDGYADAVRAHLTLLLVRLGRLRPGPPDDPGVEPCSPRCSTSSRTGSASRSRCATSRPRSG